MFLGLRLSGNSAPHQPGEVSVGSQEPVCSALPHHPQQAVALRGMEGGHPLWMGLGWCTWVLFAGFSTCSLSQRAVAVKEGRVLETQVGDMRYGWGSRPCPSQAGLGLQDLLRVPG